MANLSSDDQNGGSSWGFILAAGSAALVAVVKAFVIGYYNSTRECYDQQNCGWGWGYFVATGIGAVLVAAAVYAMLYLQDEKDCHQGQRLDESLQCKMSTNVTESAIPAAIPMKVLKCGHPFHEECIDYWLKDTSDCPMCTPPQQ